MSTTTAPYAMSVKEAADYLHVSEQTIRRAIKSAGGPGALPPLPARMVGRRPSITRADLEAWHASLPEA